jgi:hypothetical protein
MIIDKDCATTILLSKTLSETKQQYLGTTSSHNIYAAELIAIKLAVDMLQSSAKSTTRCE